MSDYIQANSSGLLHDAAQPSVSPLNRGFLYGDAIYEVWRTCAGVVFAFDEHWERLGRSAAALRMDIGMDQDRLLAEMGRTAAAFRERTGHAGDLYLRLQITRGAGAIGLDTALADRPFWVILVQALKPHRPAPGRAGLHLSVARELRRNAPDALDPAWKTGNYLNNMLCLREARARGADEVVILNRHGAVSEAAVCNIFFARGGEAVTPPLAAGILGGVTRKLLLGAVAARAGVAVRERGVGADEIGAFDECFLSSTTRDVAAVARIDEHAYRVGADTTAARLKEAFALYVNEYTAAHPELRL
jgi:branched-chain amino acid aminotransferase